MSLPLTKDRIAAIYSALKQYPPFNRMKLPPVEQVRFRILRTKQVDGEYWRFQGSDDHTISVSAGRNGHWDTLGCTVAHEMIHLHQARAKTETRGQHNAEFHRIAKSVCKSFGWDEKQFT